MALRDWDSDFIADFMAFTDGAFSPDIFRLWSAISLVAGALERRVWIKMGSRLTFANLYVLLVAPPGVGKYTIEQVRELWTEVREPGGKNGAFFVASDSVTKASLIDELGDSGSQFLPPQGQMITYHSLLVAAEELAVLLPGYDLEFIGALNSIYNNKPLHKEKRRTGTVKEIKIEYPQLNILAGAQPGWLASVFPEEAWSTGLASRLIMIYAPEGPLKDLFAESEAPEELRAKLIAKLTHLKLQYGQMQWTAEAAAKVGEWHLAGGPPTPGHSKLAHYNRRRTSLHMPKLAMVSAISRHGKLVIELQDVERAIAWLTSAEAVMPDIFRAMVGRSDSQVIEELHFFLTSLYIRNKHQPVHERALFAFLAQRVPSDKVEKIIALAERSNVITRMAGESTYKPMAKHEHGVE